VGGKNTAGSLCHVHSLYSHSIDTDLVKDQSDMESVNTSRYVRTYICVNFVSAYVIL
jgi:hypothetical protein